MIYLCVNFRFDIVLAKLFFFLLKFTERLTTTTMMLMLSTIMTMTMMALTNLSFGSSLMQQTFYCVSCDFGRGLNLLRQPLMIVHRPLRWRKLFWPTLLNFQQVLLDELHERPAYPDKHFDPVNQFHRRLIHKDETKRNNKLTPIHEQLEIIFPHSSTANDTKPNQATTTNKKRKEKKSETITRTLIALLFFGLKSFPKC